MNKKTKILLDDALGEGEILRWAGVTQPFSLLDDQNKKRTMMIWIIAAALLIAMTGGYIIASAANEFQVKAIVFIFTVGIPLLVFVDPIRDKKQALEQIYAITDRRVITCHKNVNSQDKVYSLILKDVREQNSIRSIPGLDGNRHICFGQGLENAKPEKLLKIAISGKTDKEDKLIGLVFYNMSEEDAQKAIDAV